MTHLEGGNKGGFYPRDNFILCHRIQINLFHRIKIKNIKKLFLCGNFD
jgi:hypothetical protein